MNLLLHLSRQFPARGRGTVFLIINLSYVAGVLKVRGGGCGGGAWWRVWGRLQRAQASSNMYQVWPSDAGCVHGSPGVTPA